MLRTVYNAPVTGYIDLVELSMASMAFLGAAYCQGPGAHIRMKLLIGRLEERALRLAADPSRAPVGVVLMKDVAHHAQDEIHEIMDDDARGPKP